MRIETIRKEYRELLEIVIALNTAAMSAKPGAIPFFAANRSEGEDSADAAFRIYANYALWLTSILAPNAPCSGQKIVKLMSSLIRSLFNYPGYDIQLNKALATLFEAEPFDPNDKDHRVKFQTILEQFQSTLES